MKPRVAIFVDGNNAQYTLRALKIRIDWAKFAEYFSRDAEMVDFRYYLALDRSKAPDGLIKMLDWMDYQGFTVVTDGLKPMIDVSSKLEGDMDAPIAADMIDLADQIDKAVLFSGDQDFSRAVQILKRRGVEVLVVSGGSNFSTRLRHMADKFLYIERIRDEVSLVDTNTPVKAE